MKHVSASQFKAKCSALVEQVRRTKRAIQITRRGKVIAEITPVASEKSRGWLGRMKGTAEIVEILSHLLLTWKTLKRLRTKNRPQTSDPSRLVTPVP
jgi:prevent-host-death family protein